MAKAVQAGRADGWRAGDGRQGRRVRRRRRELRDPRVARAVRSRGPRALRGRGTSRGRRLMPSPGPAGELRFDPLTREWVNIVGSRQTRPNLPTSGCPFCVGGLEAPDPYDVRWFANRWPALAPDAPVDFAAAEAAGTASVPAVGRMRGRALLARPRRIALDAAGRAGAQGRRPLGRAHRGAARPARGRVRARVRESWPRGRRDDRPPARTDLRLPVRAALAGARGGRRRARTAASSAPRSKRNWSRANGS